MGIRGNFFFFSRSSKASLVILVVLRGILIHFDDVWGKIVIMEDLGAF